MSAAFFFMNRDPLLYLCLQFLNCCCCTLIIYSIHADEAPRPLMHGLKTIYSHLLLSFLSFPRLQLPHLMTMCVFSTEDSRGQLCWLLERSQLDGVRRELTLVLKHIHILVSRLAVIRERL